LLLFFLYMPEQDRLQGVHAGGAPLAGELAIPLTEGRSLVAMALRHRRAVHAFEAGLAERLTVVDRQVARMLEHEGILCLPLLADGLTVGTLVAGIDRARLEHHSAQLSLLQLFGAEAAGAIVRQQAMVETERRIIENERALYETRTRMLVHEASNPLAIVNNYLHVLGMKLGEEHPVHEELGILKEEIGRVGHILLRMRDLSREDEQEQGVVDVNVLIRDLVAVFRASLFKTHNIEASLDLDEHLAPIVTHRARLKQILVRQAKLGASCRVQVPVGRGIRKISRKG
jgi:signal transduction histidine kinase